MKFTTPATTNPIDQLKVIGKPTDRIDGPMKTSGTAPYAYEQHAAAPNAAYGHVIGAAIAKGKIASIDTAAAKRAPGVLAIVTYENAGKLEKGKFNTARLLAGPEVQHYHQAVAVVVAETFEQARAAANLVKVDYVKTKGEYDLKHAKGSARLPKKEEKPETKTGDFAGAFASAPVKLDATYTTPDQSHAMMEPHASMAIWEGDKLTLYTANQMIDWGKGDMAKTLGIPKENVRLISPYIGGGFGGKLFLRSEALMAALGARAAGRPVKIALQRALMFNNTTHRPATIQRIRIGATREGRITAISHESTSGDLPDGQPETAVQQTRLLYAGANRFTQLKLATLDLPEANAMRAPGEAPGMMALEIAIDEMAEKLNMDPVTFRIVNDTTVDPENRSRKFSQRRFVETMRQGAERFGWKNRNPEPAKVRDGRWLIGMGVASAFRNNMNQKSAARARLERNGTVTIETDMTDIGTGSYTIIAQTAAEMMGLPIERITVRLGDSSFPVSSRFGRAMGRQQLDRRRVCGLRQAARSGGRQARRRSRDRRIHGRQRAWGRQIGRAGPGGERRRDQRRGHDGIRRPGKENPAVDLRRPFRRSRGRFRHGRSPRAAHAGRLRGRSHPEPEIGAQPGDRRDDDGRGRGLDGTSGGRQAHRLLREPRPGRLRSAGARRHSAPGGDLPRRNRSDELAHEGQGRGRTGYLRRRGGGGERHLQRHRRARARLSDHARQAAAQAAGLRVRRRRHGMAA
jgi:hypothetical protein